MGDGNRKTKRLLAEQPTCTYCGGLNASTSRDHCPPITAFDDRWRPEGMEFGACHACHEGTREMDSVVGFVSRIRGTEGLPNSKAEMERHVGALVRRYPHLLEHLSFEAQPVVYNGSIGHVAHIGQDSKLHGVMDAYAARMGLAGYRLIKGQPAPASARILCRWDTNVGMDNDQELNAFLQTMGLPQTLVQGKQHVADQFRIWPATDANEPNIFGVVAVFRESFGIVAFVDTRDGEPEFEPMFVPGFLQGYKV